MTGNKKCTTEMKNPRDILVDLKKHCRSTEAREDIYVMTEGYGAIVLENIKLLAERYFVHRVLGDKIGYINITKIARYSDDRVFYDKESIQDKMKVLIPRIDDGDVYLRAEDEWIDWDDFSRKRSFENIESLEIDHVTRVLQSISKGKGRRVYEVEYGRYGRDVPVRLIANGVNAIPITSENICSAVHDLRNMGYGDEEFVFVIFKGEEIGENLVGDGVVVKPTKLLKLMPPGEMFDICKS